MYALWLFVHTGADFTSAGWDRHELTQAFREFDEGVTTHAQVASNAHAHAHAHTRVHMRASIYTHLQRTYTNAHVPHTHTHGSHAHTRRLFGDLRPHGSVAVAQKGQNRCNPNDPIKP